MAYSISEVFFTKYSDTLLLSVTHSDLSISADLAKTKLKWQYLVADRKTEFMAGCSQHRLSSGTTAWLSPCGTNGNTQTFIIKWSDYSLWNYYYVDKDDNNDGEFDDASESTIFVNASGPQSAIPNCVYSDWLNWNRIGAQGSDLVATEIYNASNTKIASHTARANAITFYNGDASYASRAGVGAGTNWQSLQSSTSACSVASIEGGGAGAYGDPHISPLFGKKYTI